MNKLIIILLALVVVAVVIVDLSIKETRAKASLEETVEQPELAFTSEKEVFKRTKARLEYTDMPHDAQHAEHSKEYYKRRAYHGAPPQIPHKIFSKKGIGGNSCLQCHENGGFAEEFNAYTPVTPHPELISCRQCHVPVNTQKVFAAGSNWVKEAPPSLDNRALVSSPPTIPHGLQNRKDCLSCHAGSGGLVDIRSTHTERVNCLQCHVPNTAKIEGVSTTWKRK